MIAQVRTAAARAIDPATEVGLLSLTVSDLARSVAFYSEGIGFAVLHHDGSTATLGVAGTPLLLLAERTGAKPWPREQASYTGLYHFAILLPTRADLGRWLRHWLEAGFPLPGQGDHLVSEALYLSDPDENGIEVYRDRPRDEWHWANGLVRMGTGPVDIRGLLTEAERANEPWASLPAGTRLGHIHLQIGDITEAAAFYHDILGFDIVARMPSALFVSAGGYHHHIGMNTWHSAGATPAPADMVGLRFFTINFPTEEARQAVLARIAAAGLPTTRQGDTVALQDPWQNRLLLQVGSPHQR
ncbi:MAG: VOC family protein [Thermomicrobiales bacterium]